MRIQIASDSRRFLLSNDAMSYGLERMETGLPVNLHWGAPLESPEDLPTAEERQRQLQWPTDRTSRMFSELPVFGGKFFDESATGSAPPTSAMSPANARRTP